MEKELTYASTPQKHKNLYNTKKTFSKPESILATKLRDVESPRPADDGVRLYQRAQSPVKEFLTPFVVVTCCKYSPLWNIRGYRCAKPRKVARNIRLS